MKETLRTKREDAQKDVQKAWVQFSEEKAKIEEAGSEPDAVNSLKDSFYSPYEKAVSEFKKADDAYRAALEMDETPLKSDEPETKALNGEDRSDKTPGDRVLESAQYKSLRNSGVLDIESEFPRLTAVKALNRTELKTLLQSGGAPGTQFLVNSRLPGVLPIMRQPLQMAQLVTIREVGEGNTVEWVRHSATTNNAAETAEASATAGVTGTKPESAITFVVENTPLRMIAHWIPATRQALQDMPQLRGIVDDELVEGVNRRVNTQILSGDGIAPNLTGILNTAGIGTQALGADTRPDALFKALTTLRTGFFEPSAIVMHPSDWQDFALLKDTTGTYVYGSPAMSIEPQLWGVRVIIDTSITAGTALVGDFHQAVLFVRDGIQVLTSESHSDFFVRNMIVILAEGRYGLAVQRPSAFVTVTGI